MKNINNLNDALANWFAVIGALALFLMMGISVVNMAMRFFGRPLGPAYELVGFLGALAVSLPLGYSQLKKSHIAVDILSSHFSAPARKLVTAIGLILGAIFFGLASWQVGAFANTMRLTGELSETTKMSYYPFVFAVSAGCGLMVLSLIADLFNLFLDQSRTLKDG
ncbi:MAG: TRAP transporter small permease [Desulfomonilaceae bacterium]